MGPSNPPSRRFAQHRAAPLGGILRCPHHGDRAWRKDGVESQSSGRSALAASPGGRPGRARLREDHQRVGCHQGVTSRQQRVHVDLDDLGVIGSHAGDRLDDPFQLDRIDPRQPPDRTEQPLGAKPGHEIAAVGGIQGRQGEGHVGDGLGEDAAQPEGDHRPELLVPPHTDQELAFVRHPLLDEHTVHPAGPAVDDAVIGAARVALVVDIDGDEPDIALVLDVRAETLEDGTPAQRRHSPGCLLSRVSDRAGGRGDAVGRQERLGLALIEGVLPGLDGATDELRSRNGRRGPCRVRGVHVRSRDARKLAPR